MVIFDIRLKSTTYRNFKYSNLAAFHWGLRTQVGNPCERVRSIFWAEDRKGRKGDKDEEKIYDFDDMSFNVHMYMCISIYIYIYISWLSGLCCYFLMASM